MNDISKSDVLTVAREDFTTFAEIAIRELEPDLIWAPFLDLLGSKVGDVLAGRAHKLNVNMPPRHLKTLVCSVAATAWAIGRDPATQVLGVSHSQLLSRNIADLTLQLMNSSFFKACFPGTQLRSDRSPVLDFTTTRGGGRLTSSFDSNITGRGADLIIVDDAHSANEVSSHTIRESTISSFQEMVVHRKNDPKTGRILIVAQRLHENDLSGELIAQGYPTLTLPFEAIEPERYVYRGGVFERAIGEVLHPVRFGPEQVAELKRTTLPHVYSTQFQQVPRRMSSGEIKAEDFPVYESVPAKGEVIFSWDVASTTGPSSSNSVCLVFERHEKIHHLRHVWKNRVHFGDLKEIAFDLHSRFKPSRHLIEAASLGNALGAELSGRGVPVELLNTGSLGKQQRLEAQFHQIKGRRVFLPRNAEWRDDFLDELLAFPHGSRDDQVDALSQYLAWAGGVGSRPPATPVSIGFGSGKGDRKTRSARYSDMRLRMGRRR